MQSQQSFCYASSIHIHEFTKAARNLMTTSVKIVNLSVNTGTSGFWKLLRVVTLAPAAFGKIGKFCRYFHRSKEKVFCSTQLPVHQRMNPNGVRYQMIYFPETNNTIIRNSCYGYKSIIVTQCTITLTLCINVSWWCQARLLCFEPSSYVYPPPLSEANCPPFPPPGGPGPPGFQDGFLFPKIHTYPLHTVCYRYNYF